MNKKWLTIKQIDRQLNYWQSVRKKCGVPKTGWIKTLRVALSMSAAQFGDRLGLTRGRINQLENAEVNGRVKLRTLQEAANAIGCELIYAVVPKGNTTLENIIKKRAEKIAKEKIANVAHSMSLEAQSIDSKAIKIQKDLLIKELTDNLNKKLWENNKIK